MQAAARARSNGQGAPPPPARRLCSLQPRTARRRRRRAGCAGGMHAEPGPARAGVQQNLLRARQLRAALRMQEAPAQAGAGAAGGRRRRGWRRRRRPRRRAPGRRGAARGAGARARDHLRRPAGAVRQLLQAGAQPASRAAGAAGMLGRPALRCRRGCVALVAALGPSRVLGLRGAAPVAWHARRPLASVWSPAPRARAAGNHHGAELRHGPAAAAAAAVAGACALHAPAAGRPPQAHCVGPAVRRRGAGAARGLLACRPTVRHCPTCALLDMLCHRAWAWGG